MGGCFAGLYNLFRRQPNQEEYLPVQNGEDNENIDDNQPKDIGTQVNNQYEINNQEQVILVLLTLMLLKSLSILCEQQKIQNIDNQYQNFQNHTQYNNPQNFNQQAQLIQYDPSLPSSQFQQYQQNNYPQHQDNSRSTKLFLNESNQIEQQTIQNQRLDYCAVQIPVDFNNFENPIHSNQNGNNFEHQYQNQSQEIESTSTSMINYQCFQCKMLIMDSVYQTECQHSYHVTCFDEMIAGQIMKKSNLIQCLCGSKLSSKILLQSNKQNYNYLKTQFYQNQLNTIKQQLESENMIWKCENQNCQFFCKNIGLENSICSNCIEPISIEPSIHKKIKIISEQQIPLQQDFQQQQINNNPYVEDQQLQVQNNPGQEYQQINNNLFLNQINHVPFETNQIQSNIQNNLQNQDDEFDVLQTHEYETPCIRCQNTIHNSKIQTICQHNYHQMCIEEMLVMQVNNQKLQQLQCLCNVKLNIKILFQFDLYKQQQIKEQLYQNQLGLLATNLQQVIIRCPNNCGFFYINKTNEKSFCQQCDQ